MAAAAQRTFAPTSLLKSVRGQFGLSQQDFADLLGCSLRAVQSAEQGWRHSSPALEKLALLLLVSLRQGPEFARSCCWETNKCPRERRERCLTYRYRQGHLCWFLTSTMCSGRETRTWAEKRAMCLRCSFFKAIFDSPPDQTASPHRRPLTPE